MDIFLFSLGFLLLVGSIVYLVVSLIKRNFQGKRLGLLIATGLVLMIVGLSLPSDNDDTAQQVATESDVETEKEEISKEPELTEEEKAAKKAEQEAKEKAEKEAKAKAEEEARIKAEEEAKIVAYSAKMAQYSEEMAGFIKKIGDLSTEAGANPYLMFEGNWISNYALALVGLDTSIEQIRKVSPPAQFEDSHAIILEGLDHFEFVVDNMPTAIDNMDADLIVKCSERMSMGGQLIREATSLMESKM